MTGKDDVVFHAALGPNQETDTETIKQLNRRRGSVKCRLTNFKKFASTYEGLTLSDTQRTELSLRMQGAQGIFDDFTDIHNQLESLIPDSEMNSLFETREAFESEYYAILAKTQCMVKCSEKANEPKMQASNNLAQTVRLPVISLPTFDGSYEHWLQFRDTFSSLVHNSQEITSIQKFHYLKSSLKGNALLVIDSLEFSADNYAIAWELLLNRYDNSRLLVHNHVKALFSIQSLNKESPALLRKLLDTVLKNLRALKLLGEPTESWDTLIIYLVVSKLDSTTEREWEQYKSTLLPVSNENKTALKVDDLLKFIRDRADMLETLLVTHSRSNLNSTYPPHDAKKSNTHNAHTAPKVHYNVVTEKSVDKSHSKQTPIKKLCSMCNGKHPLYSCQAFIDLNMQDKLKLVRDKSLCENCLRTGHAPSECRYGPCRKCNKKHNSIIHEDEKDEASDKRSVALLATDSAPRSPASSSSIPDNNIAHAQHVLQVSNAHIDEDVYARLSSRRPVILATALVEIPDNYGNYHKTRVILDNGSEGCLITEALCDKLNPQTLQSTEELNGIGNLATHSSRACEIEINSLVTDFKARLQCRVLPRLTSSLPTFPSKRNHFRIPDNVSLADPNFYESRPVEVLIGADLFWELLEGLVKITRLTNGAYLINTQLGWIVSGPVSSNARNTKPINCNFAQSIDMPSLDTQLRRFWEIEEIQSNTKSYDTRSEEEMACEDHFVKTTTRLEDGRFCVQLPLKEPPESLGDSFAQAKRRYMSLEKRLSRDPIYKGMYSDFIKEYLALGHMKRVNTYGTPNYFLAHHGIYRAHAQKTRLRVVFDASAPTTSGKSLNDIQMVGAPIQGDLVAILLRFRENRYVACADIEKHYRQVLIDESQRDLQLILWRDKPSDDLDIYQLSTVTYGTAAAAFLSCRCLKQLALECTDPEVARTIRDDFYVDDFISGSSSIPELLRICDETAKVLNSGCFPLRKWVFNFECTDKRYNDDDTSKELSLGEHAHSKTLGLGWYNKSDELFYHTRHEENAKPVTKRIILSTASQVFDPLGLLSPMIIIAKCLLQRLFLLKVDWDAAVPDDVTQAWHRFVNNLAILPSIRIPRHVMCNDPICIDLHIFTDASQVAYGTCAYVRTIDKQSAVTVQLLCSKSKVAPISPPLSTPRLELSACLLGAKLFNKIKESFRAKFNQVIFHTDSTIALSWLRMQPNLLKPFVQNRVAQIHEITKEYSWHHVSGKCNPADLVSRGVQLDALRTSSLWWNGPDFLHDVNYNAQSVDPSLLSDESQIPERKTNPMTSLVCNDNNNTLFTFDRFSQFNRMQRAAAYVLRFIHNARNKDARARRTGALTVDELRQSERVLSRLSQLESLSDVRDELTKNRCIAKGFLAKLNLFIDNNNLIRVGGRLANSARFDYNKKHPILLSSKHQFTMLLFRFEHKRLLHAGPQHILFSLREAWWPISGRNLARKVVHNCVLCVRFKGKTLTPIMGNLPTERLEPGFAFANCAVDYGAILNSRPLSPLSSDPQDYTPLTPAHFLVGRPLTAPACADLVDAPAQRLSRYQQVEQMRQHFWARWSKEFISELQVRTKWTKNMDDLKVDTLVLIKEDHTPPLKWSLGRITKTFPGKDGVSRVADIRTSRGTVRRAFSKICPLPTHDD
ncbi:uncharacterized protein LOC125238053 [Leguminivora glycinivorella]|uniref:uncharacterized protein LOC125238053 n=1 Tax=Leguminivora glycinivorella TaxID=1035111 RepID=UPI0020104EEB|nr:uncharacterized protein LOC125238053 [Leguminivora glycinivorella]